MITDKKTIDWEQRRYEIAKEVLSAMISNEQIILGITSEGDTKQFSHRPLAETAVRHTDILIEELKKKGETT